VLLHDGGDRVEDLAILVTLLRLEMLDVPRLRDAERRALGQGVGGAVEEDVVVDQVARNLLASSRGRLDGDVVQLLRGEEQLDSSRGAVDRDFESRAGAAEDGESSTQWKVSQQDLAGLRALSLSYGSARAHIPGVHGHSILPT
jgi:hypothetical protein